MKNSKQFIQFYFLELLFIFIYSFVFGHKSVLIFKEWFFWIIPILFCVAGFFIGKFTFELYLRYEHLRKRVFFIGYLINFLGLVALMIFLHITGIKETAHDKHVKNIEDNHRVIKFYVNDNEEYVRIAFNSLESEFKNPNNFSLDAFSVRKHDSIINGKQDTLYNIYFVYFLDGNNKDEYFSKVSVFKNTASLQLYDLDTKTNAEYLEIRAEKDKTEKDAMKSINEALQKMQDPARNMIKDKSKDEHN